MSQSIIPELRVAVIGAGVMGADHVARITRRISGARVCVVSDAVPARAELVAAEVPGARVIDDPFEAIAAGGVDAVILASPGDAHASQLHACLAVGRPVLCEKPMTTDVASALELVRREAATGRTLIQVGFMRRFDPEYRSLKHAIDIGELGRPLLMHCVHRNPSAPPGFDSARLINESLVHEVDVTRFVFDEEIVAVTVVTPASSSSAGAGLRDPQIVLLETASGRITTAEVFVTSGLAYEVRTEVVCEKGSAAIGFDRGMIWRRPADDGGAWGGAITSDFRKRFADAYHNELQGWVDVVVRGLADGGVDLVDGAGAWDGYAATAVCAAAVRSLETGHRVAVDLAARHESKDAAGAGAELS